MNLIGVVAISSNFCIGKDGNLPWRHKEDMDYFRKLTLDSTVIMGRKTWDSIPLKFRPLERRNNVIITRNPPLETNYKNTTFTTFEKSNEVLSKVREPHFIIGGMDIYRLFWPQIQEFHITHIDEEVVNGDTFFPILMLLNEFKVINSIKLSDKCEMKHYKRI